MLSRLAQFDQFSFWLGFIAASLFWWLMARIWPALRQAWTAYRARREQARTHQRTGVEFDYRNEFIQFAQSLHLASALFSLQEIALTPRVLAPPPLSKPGEDLPPSDALSRVLPYIPEQPVFAATFGVERHTLPTMLSKGSHLVLLGDPGSGKTTALAHLGTWIASLSPSAGPLAGALPFYAHAADLILTESFEQAPAEAMAGAVLQQGFLSRKTSSRLAEIIEKALADAHLVLLLDGLDELAPKSVDVVVDFLSGLLEAHPSIRVIAAASPEYYDGLTRIGLAPVFMAGWDPRERVAFIRRWGSMWEEHVSPEIWPEGGVERVILENWLESDRTALTPMEITLRAWAGYAGDSLGAGNPDAIGTFVRRSLRDIPGAEVALERIAMQMVLTMRPVAHEIAILNWARGNLVDFTDQDLAEARDEEEKAGARSETIPGRVGRSTLQALVEAGILVSMPGGFYRFTHLNFEGFFAGRGIAQSGGSSALAGQPDWGGKQAAMHFLACFQDITPVLRAAETQKDPLHRQLFSAARWLRDMAPKSPDRMHILRRLASLFQNEKEPAYLRQLAAVHLAVSGDPGAAALGKKLLQDKDPLTRAMSALVLGYHGEVSNAADLSGAISDDSLSVRTAACFALANTGTEAALETVATVLLHGDEESQRAAAEALALNPTDGFELLMEAASMDELLVRRAAIFGLEKTGQEKALKQIEKLQLEDEQWIVRNAADQVMEKIKAGSPSIPTPLPPLHETGWLIQFAGQSGEGIAPGRSAEESLYRALLHGSFEEQLAAMDRYRLAGDARVVPHLLEMIQTSSIELQTAAILTLHRLASQGIF